MIFDVIIPVCSKDEKLIKITLETLISLFESKVLIDFNVLIIESGNYFDYTSFDKRISQVFYSNVGGFNYNHALNLGLKVTRNKYVLLCNNDLQFNKGFAEKLMRGFDLDYLSLSPRTLYRDKICVVPDRKEGYLIGQHIHGCCIAINRQILKTIEKLDENCEFWFSDHVYAQQLKRNGIKHRLMTDAIITHLESQTLNTLTADQFFDLTCGQLHKWKVYNGEIKE